MSKLFPSALISSLILLFSCTQRPLIPKDNTNEAERNNHLFVFVGEKIEVKELKQDEDSWDGKFYARFKILQKVYGDYDGEFIEFTAYDHYGIPGFSNYKNCLLFVRKKEDAFIHVKYEYYDVYKTKDNRWAGRYSVADFGRDGGECYGVKPEKIDFQEPVSFLLSDVEDQNKIDCWFPQPYYKLDSVEATAVYGNYIEDIFKIKKQGELKARGLFGEISNGSPTIEETQLGDVIQADKPDYKRFENFLKFSGKSSVANIIARYSLDTIIVDGRPADKSSLIKNDGFNADLSSVLNNNIKSQISIGIVDSNISVRPFFMKHARKTNRLFIEFSSEFVKETVRSNEEVLNFGFIKTKDGFKLYRCNHFNRSICTW